MTMNKQLISVFATLLFGTTCVRADVVDVAYEQFMTANYKGTFNLLLEYRLEGKQEPTLRVDFTLLAVSGCHLGEYERALGGYLLSVIPVWYENLTTVNLNSVSAQAQGCPLTQFSATDAIARIGRQVRRGNESQRSFAGGRKIKYRSRSAAARQYRVPTRNDAPG